MQPFVICGDIDAAAIGKCLQWIAANRASPLDIWLCSDGGDLTPAMALYGALATHIEPVTVTVMGSAESCAAIILQAADHRRIMRSAYIMMHRGATSQAEVSPDEAVSTAEFLSSYYDYTDELVYLRMKKSGAKISRKRYREDIQQAVFYTADEALKMGLVDEIVEG